jgi:hypothetical protein
MTMQAEDIANNVLSATVKHPEYRKALDVFDLLMRSHLNGGTHWVRQDLSCRDDGLSVSSY